MSSVAMTGEVPSPNGLGMAQGTQTARHPVVHSIKIRRNLGNRDRCPTTVSTMWTTFWSVSHQASSPPADCHRPSSFHQPPRRDALSSAARRQRCDREKGVVSVSTIAMIQKAILGMLCASGAVRCWWTARRNLNGPAEPV